jgi:hypothetical protein
MDKRVTESMLLSPCRNGDVYEAIYKKLASHNWLPRNHGGLHHRRL